MGCAASSREFTEGVGRDIENQAHEIPSSSSDLITLSEAAALLGLTKQRLYQMDEELHPIMTPRGTKMKARHYQRDIIEQVRAERASQITGIHSPAVQCLHRRAAKEAVRDGIAFNLGIDDYVDIGMMPCILCGRSPMVREIAPNGPSAALHTIIRVVHGQGLDRENAAPACVECVLAMGTRDVRAHIAHCRSVVLWQERLGCF